MNITKENVDALNTVITVDVATEDYQTKVTEILQNYRKKADVPGFRKGYVPMGIVKKQYGKSVMIDEVIKLLQESIINYLIEEKLDVLGGPLPIIKDDFSWDAETFSFKFELGLAPKFTIDLSSVKKEITRNNIIADDIFIDEMVEELQYNYGETSSLDKVTKTSKIIVNFSFNGELDREETIFLKKVKEQNLNKFLGAKIGEVIEFEIKELSDDNELAIFLEMYDDDIPESKITLTIKEIIKMELAELNQEFFDKIHLNKRVESVTELRNTIKEDFKRLLKEQTDQLLLVDITKYLVEKTKFDLPVKFLQKFLSASIDYQVSKGQIAYQYARSEKNLRRQLIENKILEDNNITIDYQELVDYTKGFVKIRMAELGNMNLKEKELNDLATRVLEDEDKADRFQEQLTSEKLITFYKENITFKTREIFYSDILKETYQ